MKKLGILLATPPTHKNRITAFKLAGEAVRQGIHTYLYLIDDGVYNAADPETDALAASGVHIFLCAYGAKRRGISEPHRATFAGLAVLSDLMKGCDRFISFT